MKHRRNRESGFAMLLIFAMAGAVAIMLYMQLPRVSFESQRAKEQLLIERGEQYQRGIQLFFRKFKRYPGKIEDLENTNNIRFLRRRYVEPMSGKSEWRLIHIGPGGVFTDSLTRKPKKDNKEKSVNNFIAEGPEIGAALPQGPQTGVPPRRPSEGGTNPGVPGPPGAYMAPPGSPDTVSAAPGGVQGQFGQVVPGQIPPGQFPAGVPYPQQALPNQPGQQPEIYLRQPVNSQTGGVSPVPYPTQPGTPGVPTTGQNDATRMIQDLLTRPRPGGFPGAPGQAGIGGNYPSVAGAGEGSSIGVGGGVANTFGAGNATAATGGGLGGGFGTPGSAGLQIGGGIAGVASTVEKQGIKLYNERDKYNEWEFIYDFGKDRTMVGSNVIPGAGQQPGGFGQQQPGALGQQQPGAFGQQQPGAFGQQPMTHGQLPAPLGQQPQPAAPSGPQPFIGGGYTIGSGTTTGGATVSPPPGVPPPGTTPGYPGGRLR